MSALRRVRFAPSLRSITQLALLGAWLTLAPHASAAGEEERARNLNRDAMETDYLGTDFKAALAKLETAKKLCGADKCPKELVARIHRNLGTVYSAGLNQHEQAVEAFKEMLRIEPTLSPDSNYLTGAVQKAYDDAKAASGPGSVVVEKAVGVLEETPWTEQATYQPVPVFVKLPEGAEATRVVVRYKAPGAADWSEVQLRALETGGFGGLIPCAAVEKEGTLLYFVTAFDANLDRVASAGSTQAPRKVTIKKAISGRQPALPGSEPPAECPRPEERLSCETNDDCPGDSVCENLSCVASSSVTKPEEDTSKQPRANHFTLSFSPDLLLLGSKKNVCQPNGQADGQYSCFFSDGTQYTGTGNLGGGSINGGVATAISMRVMLGYDRVFAGRFAAGVRAGFAFLGRPDRKDGETPFSPLHLEARFTAHLFPDSYARKGARPYAYVNGGMATVSGRVSTTVRDDSTTGSEQAFKLDVYQSGGQFFFGGGLGLEYAVDLSKALRLDVGVRQMLPASTLVIAPTLGFAFGF